MTTEAQRESQKLELRLRSLLAKQVSASAAGDSALEQSLLAEIEAIKRQLRILGRDVADIRDDVEQLRSNIAAVGARQVQGGGGGGGGGVVVGCTNTNCALAHPGVAARVPGAIGQPSPSPSRVGVCSVVST